MPATSHRDRVAPVPMGEWLGTVRQPDKRSTTVHTAVATSNDRLTVENTTLIIRNDCMPSSDRPQKNTNSTEPAALEEEVEGRPLQQMPARVPASRVSPSDWWRGIPKKSCTCVCVGRATRLLAEDACACQMLCQLQIGESCTSN